MCRFSITNFFVRFFFFFSPCKKKQNNGLLKFFVHVEYNYHEELYGFTGAYCTELLVIIAIFCWFYVRLLSACYHAIIFVATQKNTTAVTCMACGARLCWLLLIRSRVFPSKITAEDFLMVIDAEINHSANQLGCTGENYEIP